jgi:hypothetical protein
MSDRETSGFDRHEIGALHAALLGGAAVAAAAGSLGGAGLWAHILWRRRAGGLAVLPTTRSAH